MDRIAVGRAPLAAVGALLAGIAWIAWAVINSQTHGGLDAGPAAVGERVARAGALLMVAWNVLLIPAALEIEDVLGDRAPRSMRLVTLAGVASLLFWAFGGATRTITPALEVSYLLLSAFWWGGIGAAIRRTHRGFGAFTLLLAAFTLWDAVLTAFEPVPFALYVTAAPKLPLAIVWDFWLAVVLLHRRHAPTLEQGADPVSGQIAPRTTDP
jgi:hypothetical protein